MLPELDYFIKANLILTVFYFFYWLHLRKTTFYSLNRFYLLGGAALSLLIPFVVLPLPNDLAEQTLPAITIQGGTFVDHEQTRQSIQTTSWQFDQMDALALCYYLGVAFLSLKVILDVRKILLIKKRGHRFMRNGKVIILTEEVGPFSFLNLMFLNRNNTSPAIELHEEAHVTQRHWIDLVFLETVCVLFWFNPVIWFYKRALQDQHEYLADSFALKNGVSTEEYLLAVLQSVSHQEPIGPVNKFSSQSLKKRIIMLTKNKSSLFSKLVYLLAVPVACILLFSFSKREVPNAVHDAAKVVIIDAAHGGSDVGSKSSSGAMEKELTLSIALQVQKLAREKGLTVLLTRSTDQSMDLKDRVAVAQESKADLFVSLHCGFDAGTNASGIDFYVCDQNAKFSESQKLGAQLMKSFEGLKGLSVNGVKNSSAYVLKNNSIPSVIIEAGYLSNGKDARFIEDKNNQSAVASKIVESLMSY